MKKIACLLLVVCGFLSPHSRCLADPPQEVTPAPQLIESLEFREVDIKDVLRQLAMQYNLNIVFSESVKGLVTVHLANVTIGQALDSIITVNGFAYSRKENVYKVTSQDEARREGRQTKLFKLNNAEAVRIKDTLTKVLSSDGSIEADPRSNSIIVTDSPFVLAKIDSMISALDEQTPQVLIEAKMVETSLTINEKLGIDWQTTVKATGSARPITYPFNRSGNDGAFNAQTTGADGSVTTGFPAATAEQFTFGTLDFTGLQAVFDALKSRQKTKLVANPRIVTLNNHNATINVGKVLSQPTYERNTTTGKMEITGWQSYNIGVNLDVTPQISPDGHVKLKLKPEVSSLIGYASTSDGVQQGPITSSRSAQTEVLLRDGQTVVIGGLVKDESLAIESKVPILGDIPLLGWFFRHRTVGSEANPTEKTDLLIFVTVKIIKDGEKPPVTAMDNSMIPQMDRDEKAARIQPVSASSAQAVQSVAVSDRPFKLEPRGKK
ncbi:MAG: secretin N-terminal domain-containing protein [Deltaproteobacteria bacterium]